MSDEYYSELPDDFELTNIDISDFLPDGDFHTDVGQYIDEARDSEKQLNGKVEGVRISRFITNTRLRIYLTVWSSFLVSCWLWKVGEILMNNNDKYCLSDTVLITLITTTTIKVIAIVLVAMYDLYNMNKEDTIKK